MFLWGAGYQQVRATLSWLKLVYFWAEYGDLYMWGWNQSGQLGLQSDPAESRGVVSGDPIQRQMVAVPHPVDFPKNLEVTAVSCGSRHSAAITGKSDWYFLVALDQPIG